MTSESDVAWIITGEERTQYDALFYSQNPVDGLLTGEKVKGLFLRSNIPAHLLSKIWRLSDVNHDNLLDVGEFAIAMHLIHYHLRGKDLPSSLPQCLVPEPQPLNNVSVMTEKEREIYRQVFEKQNKDSTGYITATAAKELFLSSKLSIGCLALVWNLADIDRDGLLDSDEFAIALHVLRFLRRGNQINGSLPVLSLLPPKVSSNSIEGKQRKIAEIEIKKQKLSTVREKCRIELEKEIKKTELEREKVRVRKRRLEAQKDQWYEEGTIKQLSSIEQEEKLLKNDLQNLEQLEDCVKKLTTEIDTILQEAARLNLEEKILLHEKQLLEKENDHTKEQAVQIKISEEVDPIHSCHEKRKDLLDIEDVWSLDDELAEERESDIIPCVHIPDPFKSGKQHRNIEPLPPREESRGYVSTVFEDNFVVDSNNHINAKFDVELDTEFKTVPVTAEEDSLWSSIVNTSPNEDEGFGGSPGSENISTNHTLVPSGITWDPFPDDKSQQKEEEIDKKIEADDLLKTSSDEVAGKYQQESNVNVAEQLGDSQGDEEMDEALRESEKNRRQLCENKDSFFNPDQDENISFYSTPDDVAPPQLPMDGPPKKENKTPETNIDDFSFYFPSQSPTGKPLAEESNVASDHTDGSLFYDIMTPELPVSPPPPQIDQPIVEFDNSFYLPEGVDSTVTVKDKQDDGFGDIFLPEKPKIESSLQTPDLLSSKNDGMAFDMGNDDLLSPELPDTPPPLNISQVFTNDEKSPFYTDTDLFNQKLPNIPSPVTETNEGDLVNLEWTPISPTEESPKMEFSTKKVLVREIDSTPEIIWPSDKNDKTLLTKATKSDSIVPETQPDVRIKELETTKETIQVFNTDDALESTIETIQVFNTDDVLESTKETIQVFNTDDVMESTKERIQVFNTDDVLESTKEPIQVFNTDDDDILDASYQVYKITAEERDLRECERVDNDENIDTKPIDKHALIEKWETTMSASNDPATEDREFVSRRSIKPSMPVNVYQDFGPVFRKKEAPKRCIVEVLTTTEEEDPEFKRERLRKNIIAEQRVLKTNQVHPPWIADKNDETHTDMKTLESIKQYEERKKKKERNKSDSSTSLNDTWDSGLGDTLKSEDIPVVEDIPRQNATLAVHSGIDDDHIDRFAIQQQWDKKLAMPESENIGSENDKKQKIQDDMHRDSGEDEGESICNTAKTRMQWEQRLSLKNEIPLPVYPHVTKYNAKQQRVERQLPPKDEDHDSASASESIEGSYEFTDSSEHAYVQEDDELDDKIEKHESIIEKEIRLQREKELEFQRELQAAHSGNKYEPYVAKQQDKAVSHGYSRSEPTILDDEEESVSSNDSEKSVSSENDEVVAEKSEFGKSVLEKELRAQREKEEELLHLGRVKTCSHALPEHDDIHKTSPISIESRIEREIRQEREREEILRKERGILTRSSEDEEPAYIVSSSKPEKTRPLWQPIKTTSEPKKQNFKPDQISVSGKNEAKNIKGVNRQEAPSHYHNVLPSMEHGIDVLKEAHTVVVEQKTTFVEDQKSVPDPVNLEDSSLSDSDMEEPAAPPLNETIIQREIRLQKEREAAVQKQRERAGIAKKTNENKLEKKEKHTKDKKLDIQKINNLEVITIDKKDKKPASSCNNNNVDAKTRTAQARAVFTRPTIISVPEQNKSQPPVSKTTKIVSTKQDNDFEMPATQQNGPTNVKKETPIEKEIRLAKEKEEGLRKERGMPPLAKHDSRQQIFTDRKKSVPTALSISFEESTDYNPPGSTAKDEYMKRAANYYLEKDMADHRKREEELKKEGKIKRLSTKCKDEDDDVNGDRHPKQIQNKTKDTKSEPASPPHTETVIEREIRIQQEREDSLRKQRESIKVGKPTVHLVHTKPTTNPVHSEPVKSTPSNQNSLSGYGKYMNSTSSTKITTKETSTELDTEHNAGKSLTKPMKRRSLLAAQWEDKFK